MSANRNYRAGSLVWPIVLIGLGVLFLLNNLGIISWNVWTLVFRMWPVLVIAIGLDLLLGRRSSWGAAIAALLIMGMFAGFFWLLNISGDFWAGEQITEPITYQVGAGEEANVRIDMTVGELYIEELEADDDLFVSGSIDIGENERLTNEFEEENGVIDFTLSTKGQQYHPNWLFSDTPIRNKVWELNFSQDVLLNLQVDSGVGQAELNLADLKLAGLDINGGVGDLLVVLPAEGQFDVNIRAGVGKIEVQVPEGMAAKIFVDIGLGNTSVTGDYTHRGDTYVSDGFETAKDYVTIYLDGGVGDIRVVEVKD